MIPKLTDDAVSRLPLHGARAELLEEIVSTAENTTRSPRRSWLVPLVAAAVVAGIALSSLWWRGGEQAAPTPAPDVPVASDAAAQQEEPTGQHVVLDAPGWAVTSTEGSGDYTGVTWENGQRSFEITSYAADSYDGYVEDREHIVDPAAPGDPVEVLGVAGQLWAYSADDHTTIREVQDGHWLELRGSGMSRAAYLDLLGSLELVSRDEFEASLPDRFVTSDERGDVVQTMLAGIEDATGVMFPGGELPDLGPLEDQDPYQLGAQVTGAYACAWLDEFRSAQAAGDAARAGEAARVLGTSREWPVLQDMEATGFYPDAIWDFADQVAAGAVPQGYRGALGCS